MKLLDIYVDSISSYLGDATPDLVRQKAFLGSDIETVRLDIFLANEFISYGNTSIFNLNRDLIYEIDRVLAAQTHFLQLDGYDFLKLRFAGDAYEVDLVHKDGSTEICLVLLHDLIMNITKCLRLMENAIDALRYV